jgi:arginyl-tRNA synthetase
MNWFNFNPYEPTIKKYLFEVLKNRYSNHEKTIDRICKKIEDKDEAQNLIDFLGEILRSGYVMAINQQKETLSKLGIELKVVSPNQNKIFNQKNPDDASME